MSGYQIELVWNREFHFVPYGGIFENLKYAIKAAKELENSGDGERVKKTRICDVETSTIVWEFGRKI